MPKRKHSKSELCLAQQGECGDFDFLRLSGRQHIVPKRNGTIFENLRFYACQAFGHYADQCPDINMDTNLVQVGFIITQDTSCIKKTWLLLHTCSTHSVSNNLTLVHNIEKCCNDDILTIMTNGEEQTFSHKAKLKLLPISVFFLRTVFSNNIIIQGCSRPTRSMNYS